MKTWTGAVLAALLVAACAQPLTIASGGASLTIKAGAAGKRTLMPTLGTYDLTLTSPDHASITVTGSSTGLFNVTAVPDGTWSVQIEAFVGGNRVASGTAQVSVAPGASSSVDVPLVFDSSAVTAGSTGGIQLKIVTTASPYPVASAQVTLRDPAGVTSNPSATFSQADSSLSLSLANLASGSWVLDVVFFADSQRSQPTARVHDEILVVDGASTYPDLVLSASDFSAPGKVEMVAVAGGTFTYGTAQASLSPYWIGKYDVTQAQFQAVMGFNPSYFDNRDNGSHSNPEAAWSPVESMSLWDAMEYTNRLSLAEGLDPVYTLTSVVKTGNSITSAAVSTNLSKNGYRLPTDAEWEFAARAGNTANDPFGGNSPQDYAWVIENSSPRTYGVGQKLPNPWGLYDTWGNVYQFTNDWLAPIPSGTLLDYAGPAAAATAPFTYSKTFRGSFIEDSASDLTSLGYSGFRSGATAAYAPDIGFRIARNQGPRVPLLNFENLALGDLNGQDGWVVQTYDPGNSGAIVPYSGATLQVSAFALGSNQTKMLTLDNYMSEVTRPLDFPIDLSDPSATYVLSWETQKNAWGTEVGIGADLNGNGRIDSWLNTSEHALAVNLRQLDNGNGAHKAELQLPDGTMLSQDITAMPNENTPPGWVRVELSLHQNTVSVRWKNLASGVWTQLWSGQSFTTSLASSKANPVLWNKLFLLIQADGARVDNISFVKLRQSQALVSFESNGGSPVGTTIAPVGGLAPQPPIPKRFAYNFVGWYSNPSLSVPWNGATDRVYSDTTLYARWAPGMEMVLGDGGGNDNWGLIRRFDGSVVGTGFGDDGRVGGIVGNTAFGVVPLGFTVSSLVLGAHSSFALGTDGTLWSAGSGSSGALGHGDGSTRLSFTQVPGLSGVTRVSGGGDTSFALLSSGDLYAAGWNNYGQTGLSVGTDHFNSFTLTATGVAKAASGYYHSAMVKGDGTAWAAGLGQLGDGNSHDGTVSGWFQVLTAAATPLTNIVDVAAGFTYDAYVNSSGELWVTGNSPVSSSAYATLAATNVQAVFAGQSNGSPILLILKNDDTLWYAGSNEFQYYDGSWQSAYGLIGNGDTGNSPISTFTQVATNVLSATAGSNQWGYVKKDGSVWVNGSNGAGGIGLGAGTPYATTLTEVVLP